MEEALSYNLTRESSFSYSCNRCNKCCYDKRIRLTPYEILRLARNLRMTTRDFISQFTEEGGTVLRRRSEDGGCSLLGEEGCTVHADRPGVCRIYPLGGLFQLEGEEKFALLTPHPESLGIYDTSVTFKPNDTVASFLDAQGIAPYHRANKKYVELLTRLAPLVVEYATSRGNNKASTDINCSELEIAEWFDVDTVLEHYCSKENVPIPTDLDAQIELHIRAMEEWAQSIRDAGAITPSVSG
jgi:Fe-S-cluster containining protein